MTGFLFTVFGAPKIALATIYLPFPYTDYTQDLTPEAGDTLSAGNYYINNFWVRAGLQVSFQGTVAIYANNIRIDNAATLNGDGQGSTGGSGGSGGGGIDGDRDSSNSCGGNGANGTLGNGTGGGTGGGGGARCNSRRDGAMGGGGGGSGSYGASGGGGGNGSRRETPGMGGQSGVVWGDNNISAPVGSGGAGGGGGGGGFAPGGAGGNGGGGGGGILLYSTGNTFILGTVSTKGSNGAAGGGGGDDQDISGGGGAGGAGGSGGSIVVYNSGSLNLSGGNLRVNGGNGGNGGPGGHSYTECRTGGTSGGGGGGGGAGRIKIYYTSLINSGSYNLSGGAGGNGGTYSYTDDTQESCNDLGGTGASGSSFTVYTLQTDTTSPIVSVTGALADWSSTPLTANLSCSDSGSGCNASTYKVFASITPLGSCPNTYGSYQVAIPLTVSNHRWICAAAKDNADNTGFSTPVEFKVATTYPPSPSVQVTNSCIPGPSTTAGILDVSWNNPTDPILYVNISSDSTFATNAYHKAVSGNSTTAPDGFYGYIRALSGTPLTLQPDTAYYVRLWNGNNSLSPYPSFTIPACVTAPAVNSLSANCVTPGTIAIFSWGTSAGATSYILTSNPNLSFNSANITCDAQQCSYRANNVIVGTAYTWKIKACNSVNNCSPEVDGPTFTCNPPAYLKTTGGDVHSNQ